MPPLSSLPLLSSLHPAATGIQGERERNETHGHGGSHGAAATRACVQRTRATPDLRCKAPAEVAQRRSGGGGRRCWSYCSRPSGAPWWRAGATRVRWQEEDDATAALGEMEIGGARGAAARLSLRSGATLSRRW